MGWKRIVGYESDGSPIYGSLRKGERAKMVASSLRSRTHEARMKHTAPRAQKAKEQAKGYLRRRARKMKL